ncbi:MAG: DUF4352 domain-containing protein [Halobacteriota archaeon]
MQVKPLATITVFLLVLASLSVAGCSNTQTTQSADNSTKLGYVGAKATQVPAPSKIGSPYVYTPKAGYKFVMFNATVTNINATDRYVNSTFFTLYDSSKTPYPLSYATTDKSIASFPNDVMTHPGDKVSGLLVFEVPKKAKLTKLVYDDHPSVGPYGGYAGNVTVKL